MILYQNQVVCLNYNNAPAIMLGYDSKNNNKLWLYKLDGNGGKVDDYFTSALSYYRTTLSMKEGVPCPTPSKKRLFLGKYCGQQTPLEMFDGKTIPDTEDKLISYLKQLKDRKVNE